MSSFKFPSIKDYYHGRPMIDENLFVYEKVDGSNVSLRNSGYKIQLWSRGGQIKKTKYYFDEFRKFVYNQLYASLLALPEELVIFGEFVHKGYGHIPYDSKFVDKMLTIGIYNEEESRFLHPEERDEWLDLLGVSKIIPQVPLKSRGKINQRLLEGIIEKSDLYEGPPEGVIIHSYSPGYPNGVKLLKHYHPEFCEVDPSKKGVNKYLTRKRFVKAGQRILEGGITLDFEGLVHLTSVDVSDEMNSNSRDVVSPDKIRERILEDYPDKVNSVLESFKK
ncbi:hypothetical protein HOC13_03945 [Candidatus Woesearchaeota archaeon]|jgi:hypothetical protein|nr:hypothetical protein [Candidatus Woesearchaeota archaeon]